MLIFGAIAVAMTVRRTSGQLASMLAVNPKLSLTIMPWMPAPPHFRLLGAFLLIVGIYACVVCRHMGSPD